MKANFEKNQLSREECESLGLKRKRTYRIPIRDRSVDRNAYNVLLDGVENRRWLTVLNKAF